MKRSHILVGCDEKWVGVLTILFVFTAITVKAQQISVPDSVSRIPLTGLHFSGQMPAADMALRFGSSLNVGVPFMYKTKKNFILGAEADYFFGNNVKEDVLAGIRTPEGNITNADGNPGDIRVFERGWNLYLNVGKLIPLSSANKNSGLLIMLGLGYMQHKIKLYDAGKNIIQINGDLKKGYDRLSGGPAATQFVGYLYLSKNKLANFYTGFEFYEGYTTGLRGYQYDKMASDKITRLDLLVGFRVGWILPLYKRAVNNYYYY